MNDQFSSVLRQIFLRPRNLRILLLVSAGIGILHVCWFLPLPVIFGNGDFWQFPRGTIGGGGSDMAAPLVGYLYFIQAPWALPLLHVANLIPPDGTNIFWVDAVPWLSLTGRVLFNVTGYPMNLFGVFLLICFVLPGIAMTGLFWVCEQRNLLAAIAATALTNAAPFLLVEWGHPSLCAQFVLVFALLLYFLSIRHPENRCVGVAWFVLLALTLLTQAYLFAMVGGCWFAGITQRGIDARTPIRRLIIEGAATIGGVLAIMLLTGLLTSDVRSASTGGFGYLSMNLVSPLLPQMSGAIPPLANYFAGTRSQVYCYIGLGALLVTVVSAPAMVRRLRNGFRSHIALLLVLTGFFAFAVSNRVTLGGRLLFEVPLPDLVLTLAGAFRASGRFFWPVGYALIAVSVLTVLRTQRAGAAIAILVTASILQIVDLGPIRQAVADSAARPAPAVINRQEAIRIIGQAREVILFPSHSCIEDNDRPETRKIQQAAMELQLIAARANLPINSAYRARLETDCAAEIAQRTAPLRRGTAYFYLISVPLRPDQFPPAAGSIDCGMLDWVHYCLVPKE